MLVIVVETVIHEFGHYFGLSEEEIEAIEDEYWNADDDEIDAEEEAEGSRTTRKTEQAEEDQGKGAAERAGGEGAEAIRSAFPRTRLGRQADSRHRAGGH